MPWDDGVRELLSRPVKFGRGQAMSRFTAPTHGRWFWLALSVAAAATGFAALIPVLFDTGPALPGYVVINRLAGISFMACGLLAWRQRPDSAVGRLLTVTGFGVLLSPVLTQLDSPAAFTADLLFGDLWIALFIALFLSFVTGGRLTSTLDVILVGAFVVDLLVLPFARLLYLPVEGEPAARVARRRDGERAAERPPRPGGRGGARRGGRDRRALAFGVATPPPRAAPEPVGRLLRRDLRRWRSRASSSAHPSTRSTGP